MRSRTILLVHCLVALPALCAAQRTHQFEFGAFGSFTRYDQAFQLDNQIGGGGRLGYFFSPAVGFEFDVGFQQPSPTGGGGGAGPATLSLGGASLVLNFGNQKNLFYVLGGYSRLSFTDNVAYTFDDNAVHGGIGDRIFLNERVAVRLEGRALYAPNTNHTGGGWAGHIVGSMGLAIFTGPTAFRDADGDAVADKKDTCPNTPSGATVDAKGCPSDADADGVFNGLDACPNTVGGAEVDARGCPVDSDGDGVYNGIDKCPGTSAGAHVDASGCPTDSDQDGVLDGADKCPNTPAGTEVDTAGCLRVVDSDGDGVDDRKDTCPGTTHGTRVDASGCPILFMEAKAAVVLRGVTFEPGRSTLKPDSYTILDLVATSLLGNPDVKIEIGGHTDNTGSAATNTRLSQARADAVMAYLASKGVGPDRMVAKGYGPTQPVATNTTVDGRALNRRVELRKTN